MRRKGRRFKLFEIPSDQGVVRIELQDGGMGLYDPDGESYHDGWAAVDDIASGLVRRALLPPDEAKRVAAEAVRLWEEWRDSRSDPFESN
jgi:hypothetical protein